MPKSISFFVLIVLSILLTACGGTTTEGAVSYIATIDDAPESARVGIVAENGKFVLYICSLDDAFNLSASRWFSGDLDGDGTFAGTSPDGVKVNGAINNNFLTGFITNLQGQRLNFRGSAIPAGGPAGVYQGVDEYDGQQVTIGAIVDEDNLFAAATVQVNNSVEFITPLVTPPFRVNSSKLILTFGDLSQKVELFLVETLTGIQ
ncbi:MAG TPA: hypothetical protein PLX90_04570 [Anaerolineales bacterium]|nr:hypothetical protein [Anaerolineales bacterium]